MFKDTNYREDIYKVGTNNDEMRVINKVRETKMIIEKIYIYIYMLQLHVESLRKLKLL